MLLHTELHALQTSLQYLQNRLGGPHPDLLIVAGSGFADALPPLLDAQKLSFKEIPGFPPTTVQGHDGELILGNFQGPGSARSSRIAILRGRVHLYEGHSPAAVVHPLRTLIQWGCSRVVLTNAAGSLHKEWSAGSFMLINDHINGTGHTPLLGAYRQGLAGPMFLDMTAAYDKAWLQAWRSTAERLNIKIQEGVYLGVLGPCYETPAEVRAFQKWGADAVGMSTVLETIAARHLGARICALSLLSNAAAGLISNHTLDHQEVLAESQRAEKTFARLMAEVLPSLLA